MDEDWEIDGETAAACAMQPIDVAILVLDHSQQFLSGLCRLLCEHANWKVQRKRVEIEMRESIERIVKE